METMAVLVPINTGYSESFSHTVNRRTLLRLDSCGSEESSDSISQVNEEDNMPEINFSEVMHDPTSSHTSEDIHLLQKNMFSKERVSSPKSFKCMEAFMATQNTKNRHHNNAHPRPDRVISTQGRDALQHSLFPQKNKCEYLLKNLDKSSMFNKLTYAEVTKMKQNGNQESICSEEKRVSMPSFKEKQGRPACSPQVDKKETGDVYQFKGRARRQIPGSFNRRLRRQRYYRDVGNKPDRNMKPDSKREREERSLPQNWRSQCSFAKISTGKPMEKPNCLQSLNQSIKNIVSAFTRERTEEDQCDGRMSGSVQVDNKESYIGKNPSRTGASGSLCIFNSIGLNDGSGSDISTDSYSLTSVTSHSSFDPVQEMRRSPRSPCERFQQTIGRGRSLSESSIESEDSCVIFDNNLCSPEEGVFIYGTCSIIDSDASETWSEHETTDGEDEVDSVATFTFIWSVEDLCDESDRGDLKKINRRWQEEYQVDEKPSDKKVHFAEDKQLATVHRMIAWDYAYRAARCGPWEEYARDRARFRCRIERCEEALASVLSREHREKVWKRLMSGSEHRKKCWIAEKLFPALNSLDPRSVST